MAIKYDTARTYTLEQWSQIYDLFICGNKGSGNSTPDGWIAWCTLLWGGAIAPVRKVNGDMLQYLKVDNDEAELIDVAAEIIGAVDRSDEFLAARAAAIEAAGSFGV